MMNPKLMAMMKARRKAPVAPASEGMDGGMGEAMPETADEATTDPNAAEETTEGPAYHNEQVRRHLDKGINGSRRSAKIHLKMAKYHHDMATGFKKKGGK